MELAEREVEADLALADHGLELRRMAARVELGAARQVERQAEAEADALPHLGDALQHLLPRQQDEPSELVVRPEIAPGRPLGPVLPPPLHRSEERREGKACVS